uniref:Dynein light chain Tctex-type 1 n=1 Tax=Gorilla gorilla gorilla TaxID=9595 RepID=A0A2I2ZJ90_GORGO
MEDYQAAEETAFVVDEVKAIESTIGGNAYQHSKVNQWNTNVVEQTSSQLTKLGKPLKYIVTCVIMQKNGAGLHMASSCFWDSSADRSCTVSPAACIATCNSEYFFSKVLKSEIC